VVYNHQMSKRTGYKTDLSDDEWHFTALYLALIPFDAPQRVHDPREVLNAVRYVVKTGVPWEYLPNEFPPAEIVKAQLQRWIAHHCFENIVHDLRELLRLEATREAQPSHSIVDSRFAISTPESGSRAAYNGHKAKSGSKVHKVVDTFGYLLSLVVTAGNVDDRKPLDELCQKVQEVTGNNVLYMYADDGYRGEKAEDTTDDHIIELVVVKRLSGTKGFILLPKRWVIERSNAWMTRFRRLARDFERLSSTFAGLHWIAFGILMLTKWCKLNSIGS
jgi:transposase